ncbi:MAG: amidohydrolase family protein, partial [Pseudomonas marincola]
MKKRSRLILLVNSIAIISAFLIFQNKNISDRVIIAGATILPMSSDSSEIEAVLVDKGIIAAVGGLKELREANQDAEIIERAGQTILPGLIEPHTHPLASALLGATVDVSGFTHPNRISVISALKDAADGMGISPWLIAYGWDAAAVEDLERPSLEELDQISPERPMIILTQMMHEAYVNTAALSAVGIDPTDTNQTVHDGFVRNKNGTLNGTIREIDALGIMFEKIPPAPDSATELLLRLQYNKYAKAGYTSIGIPGVVGRHSDAIGLVKKVADQKTSPLRSYLYLLKTQIKEMQLGGSDDFKILGMKFWMDGSPYTGGAAVDTPYENNKFTIERLGIPANHKGALNFSPADLQAMISDYH